MPASKAPVAPMWIPYLQNEEEWEPYKSGDAVNLLWADGPHIENIPGSFGFLDPVNGDSTMFLELLRGCNLTPQQFNSQYSALGEFLYAYAGLNVGQWRRALDHAPDGLARLQRANDGPWADTWEGYLAEAQGTVDMYNPRVLLIPMCTHVSGSGNNAKFEIKAFTAFWLESVNSKHKPYSITGHFIQQVNVPGADGDPTAPESEWGLYTLRLVK